MRELPQTQFFIATLLQLACFMKIMIYVRLNSPVLSNDAKQVLGGAPVHYDGH